MFFDSTERLSSQSRLASRRVLIVGLGGLGCPVSLSLAACGVGRLTLVDPDRVDVSNLHRQILHRTGDVGRFKVQSAADKLRCSFPQVEIEELADAVTVANAETLFLQHDLVVDATDGAATKFLLSDIAVKTGVTLVYAGVVQLSGQAMVVSPNGPCLRCFFEMPDESALPTCAQAGVLGSVAGLVGGIAAQLALGILRGESSHGRLRMVDGKTLRMREVAVRKNGDCPSCGPSRARKPVGRSPAPGAQGCSVGLPGKIPAGPEGPVLDIRNDACPMTYVRTKLALEKLMAGDVLQILLKGQEATRNVPQNAEEEGHQVVSSELLADGVLKLSIRKGRAP